MAHYVVKIKFINKNSYKTYSYLIYKKDKNFFQDNIGKNLKMITGCEKQPVYQQFIVTEILATKEIPSIVTKILKVFNNQEVISNRIPKIDIRVRTIKPPKKNNEKKECDQNNDALSSHFRGCFVKGKIFPWDIPS